MKNNGQKFFKDMKNAGTLEKYVVKTSHEF